MLNKAIEIAVHAHDEQLDKAGEPYILHPLRVMLAQTTELERICAVMHDVVEDSKFTFSDLRNIGFSEETIIVLDFLTKRNPESYDDFIDRVLLNETACHVKLADLEDNMNLSRIKNPTQEDFERVEKYRNAKQKILNVLESYELGYITNCYR
ncbi:MAG: GTP pyrophosphokinase [Clostridia bacterium]|nr:GTP pyrophosphokinase [Clostridia bacterium]